MGPHEQNKSNTPYSSDEQEQRIKHGEEVFELLKPFAGSGSISFADIETPKKYLDDPDRHAFYIGDLLELGRDEQGPFAIVKVEVHKIQLTSTKTAVPGFDTYFTAMYPNPKDVLEGIDELRELEREYPETATYIDLDVPAEPQKFYTPDLHSCVISIKKTDL